MEWIAALVGGLGIGSTATAFIQHVISRRAAIGDRLYQEKREAYLGLLGALHKAAIAHSNENSKDFALWQTRCQLFGSPEVAAFVQAMIDTNDRQPEERAQAFDGLVEAMRSDLHR